MKLSTTILEIGSLFSLPAIISIGVMEVYPHMIIPLIVFGSICAIVSFISIAMLYKRYK